MPIVSIAEVDKLIQNFIGKCKRTTIVKIFFKKNKSEIYVATKIIKLLEEKVPWPCLRQQFLRSDTKSGNDRRKNRETGLYQNLKLLCLNHQKMEK